MSDKVNVKIKRVHRDAIIPKYAKEGDSGFDLVAVEDTIIEPGETALIKTGLAFELPDGYELQVRPRSGVTLKTKLRVQLGTVDAGYRGEVGVIVDNVHRQHDTNDFEDGGEGGGIIRNIAGIPCISTPFENEAGGYIIQKGDRIAQGVLARVPTAKFTEIAKLSETARGDGGFGSTGVRG